MTVNRNKAKAPNTIRVNGKRYYVLETGLLYREAKEMAAEWRSRRSWGTQKRLATLRDYASGHAVYVRPVP